MSTEIEVSNRTVFLKWPDKVVCRTFGFVSQYFFYDKNGFVKRAFVKNEAKKEFENSLINSGYRKK